MTHNAPPPLAVEDVVVDFPGVRALDRVSITFRPGSVHGIIGENGAGKSTLMKVLAGIQRPTGGRVLVDGEATVLRSAHDATDRGIVMIHQELNLVNDLSVAENLLLGREPSRGGLIARRQQRAEAERWLSAVGSEVNPGTRLGRLSVAQQQLVEIAKAVSQRARVIIMDEPTAVLGQRESDALYKLVRRLRDEGRTVLYISHRLAEVRHLCDAITVLRDGERVGHLEGEELETADESRLASLMVGRSMGDMAEHFPKLPTPGERVAFRCESIAVPPVVKEISLEVREGEIVGLAGLIGAGRTEWAEGVVGLRKSRGRVWVDGEPARIGHVGDALKAGIAYLTEDRKEAGLQLTMPIADNSVLATLGRYCNPSALGPAALVDRKAIESVAAAHGKNLRTKYASVRDPVSSLSGGNQQKVALAKWLDAGPRVMILDEPTRGVDVGAKEEIYRVIAHLADRGMACIVISSELPELLGLCHRVGVVRGGRLVAMLPRGEASEESIIAHAAGVGGNVSPEGGGVDGAVPAATVPAA